MNSTPQPGRYGHLHGSLLPKAWEVVAWIREYLARLQIEEWCRDCGAARCTVDIFFDEDHNVYRAERIRLYGADEQELAGLPDAWDDYTGEATYVRELLEEEAQGVFFDSFEVRVGQPPIPAPTLTQQLLGQLAALARERTS